jgi:hypothetical protein
MSDRATVRKALELAIDLAEEAERHHSVSGLGASLDAVIGGSYARGLPGCLSPRNVSFDGDNPSPAEEASRNPRRAEAD